ncbi:MAG: alkaline phosphatase family protein [Acidobacteriia bacterium]|nr:alkaline phosphatase family protein [Terriglobia bacterium]
MSARVLVIALDAAEATLIECWASQGLLPAFAKLIACSRRFVLKNSLETLPGAIWPELSTGISCGRIPHYFHPRQLHSGEAVVRPIAEDEVDPENYFWAQASRAGRRVAVVDVPQTVPASGLNGIQLLEWGLHDRNFRIQSHPPELLDEIHVRFGTHPVLDCDQYANSEAGYQDLLQRLKWGAHLKAELCHQLLARENWDLFVCCFGESHCVGHHFWHFHDPRHPWHQPGAPAPLAHAMRDIYSALDAGVGRLLEQAGPETRVFVVASHGMGLYTGGPKLLPEFLDRIGMSATGDSTIRRELQPRYLVRYLPEAWIPALRRLSAMPKLRRVRRNLGGLRKQFEEPGTRAVAVENNRCGAIRLNVKGREPYGRVEPGAEAQAVKAEIRRELLALRHAGTDQPVVVRVSFAEELFGPDHHPDVPDVIVVFRSDLGILETVSSPRIGTLHVSNYDPGSPRSGDHTLQSRLWVAGGGIAAGRADEPGNVLDLASTVLRELAVTPSRQLDGRPLDF